MKFSEFRKQPRGLKKHRPGRERGPQLKHVATPKVLAEQQRKPPERQ